MDSNNRYLVTGATGFLGQACLPFLLKNNSELIATYHVTQPDFFNPLINFQQVDLSNKKQRVALLKKYRPTHLLHLAWHVPPGNFWSSPQNLDWLKISVQLFQDFCKYGGKRFVGAGTLAEYDWNYEELDEIKTPLQPQTFYGQCKKSTYELISLLSHDYDNISIAWGRIGFFFGEKEPTNKLISQLIKKIRRKETINLVHQDTVRCYSHVRYLGEALYRLLLADCAEGAFNVSSSYPNQLKDIIEYLMKLMKGASIIKYDNFNYKMSKSIRLIPSVKRLTKAIHFNPPNTLWEDLALMVENSCMT